MAQSIPTACIPHPWHLSFQKKKKCVEIPHSGASRFMQIPTVGPREEGKYPTHGTRSKFYLMIVAKNILTVFSVFSHGFWSIALKCGFFKSLF